MTGLLQFYDSATKPYCVANLQQFKFIFSVCYVFYIKNNALIIVFFATEECRK